MWIEPVEDDAVESIEMVPDVDAGKLRLRVNTTTGNIEDVTITILDEEKVVAKKSVAANTIVDIELGADIKTWSPQNPFL